VYAADFADFLFGNKAAVKAVHISLFPERFIRDTPDDPKVGTQLRMSYRKFDYLS
jgi:hypothetical protein